jgi:hypothetical protein
MKKVIISAILSVLLAFIGFYPTASAITFSDIDVSHPDFNAIKTLSEAGIIQGYDDGTFRPDKLVNRAEALKIILASAGKTAEIGLYATGYPDIPIDAWYAGYVMQATLDGIISGNPDGTFAPGRTVNEAEYLKMTLLSFNTDLSHHTNIQIPISADTNISDWYIPYLSYAKTVGLVYPDYKNNLYPGMELNRGQCAEITYKMLLIINGGEAQKLLSMTEAKVIEAIVAFYNNDFSQAVSLSNAAMDLSEQAVAVKPDSTVLQATNTYVQSYQKAFLAHQLNTQGSVQEAQTLASEAIQLANQAITQSGAISEFAQRAIEISSQLLGNN